MFKQIFNLFKSDSLYVQALEECHEMLDIDLRVTITKSPLVLIAGTIFAEESRLKVHFNSPSG